MPLIQHIPRLTLFESLSSFYTMFIWCSIFSLLLPAYFNSIIPIFIIGLLFFKYCPILLKSSIVIWGIIYLLMLAVVISIHPVVGFGYGKGGMDTWMIEAGFILPSLAVSAILASGENTDSAKYIFGAFTFSILVSLIYVLPPLIFERNAARAISLYGDNILNDDQMQFKIGFWNYTMFHCIALAFAVMWGLRKYATSKLRFSATVLSLIIIFIVIQVSITTTFAYIIAVIGIISFDNWKRYSIIGAFILVLTAVLIVTNIDSILLWLLDFYSGSDMELKIRDIIDLLNGGTGRHGTIDGRAEYHQDNINAFFMSPIWGTVYEGGGHSVIWVRFGSGGILCGIPYIMMIISMFRKWYFRIPKTSRLYFVLSWTGAAVLLYNKGLFGESGFSMIGYIIPSIAMMYKDIAKTAIE